MPTTSPTPTLTGLERAEHVRLVLMARFPLLKVVEDQGLTTTTADLYAAAAQFIDACDAVPEHLRDAVLGQPTRPVSGVAA